jgi:hypothetical protein
VSASVQLRERAQALAAQATKIRQRAKEEADALEAQARDLLDLARRLTPEVESLVDEVSRSLPR